MLKLHKGPHYSTLWGDDIISLHNLLHISIFRLHFSHIDWSYDNFTPGHVFLRIFSSSILSDHVLTNSASKIDKYSSKVKHMFSYLLQWRTIENWHTCLRVPTILTLVALCHAPSSSVSSTVSNQIAWKHADEYTVTRERKMHSKNKIKFWLKPYTQSIKGHLVSLNHSSDHRQELQLLSGNILL